MIENHFYPTKVPGVHVSESDGHIMLSLSGSEQAFILNQTSAMIWRLSDGLSSVEKIIRMLSAGFPEAEGQIKTDVITTLESLKTAGVIAFPEG